MKVQGKLVVVTGAGSGIGRATAERLGAEGARLLLIDRAGDRVAEVAERISAARPESQATAIRLDLTEEAEVASRWAELKREFGAPAALVNSVGILKIGRFFESPLSDWDALYQVNLRPLVQLAHLAAPDMIANGEGSIVNIASASGLVGFPPLAAYSSLKFGAVGLTENLRMALHGTGVKATAVCPTIVRTPFVQNTDLPAAEKARAEADMMRFGISAERVARAVSRAIRWGRRVEVVGWDVRFGLALARWFPGALEASLARATRPS